MLFKIMSLPTIIVGEKIPPNFTGIQKKYKSDNTSIDFEYIYKKGIKTRILHYYYLSGLRQFDIPLKNHKRNGIAKFYYDNTPQSLESELFYKNDTAEGLKKMYYVKGTLKTTIPYKKGKAEGLSKLYDMNGSIKAEILYKNNKPINGHLHTPTGDLIKMTTKDLHLWTSK